MKTAFLFPGQGAQVVGMGADIVRAHPEAAQIYREANNIVGFDLSNICFEGPPDKLNTTTISQPAIFVTSAAILEMLRTHPETKNITANVTAGLSLGEYTALYAAGIISFEDALVLVQKRGQAMQAAADATEGTMPGQIVLSGTKEACRRAAELAEKHGAMKAVPLQVAGAFHTDMMASAADALSEALQQAHISEPSDKKNISSLDIKIIANINADYYTSAEKIREGLTNQLTCPIFWQKCMERLLEDGVEKFYEIGPGRVLTSLMKRINRKTKVINVSSLDAIKDIVNSEPPIN